MKIVREAMAGTLESSDISVRISPGKGGIAIALTSIVLAQFGDAIKEEITKTLQKLGVKDADVTADDKGALDCVIRARVQAAVSRAADESVFMWGAL